MQDMKITRSLEQAQHRRNDSDKPSAPQSNDASVDNWQANTDA